MQERQGEPLQVVMALEFGDGVGGGVGGVVFSALELRSHSEPDETQRRTVMMKGTERQVCERRGGRGDGGPIAPRQSHLYLSAGAGGGLLGIRGSVRRESTGWARTVVALLQDTTGLWAQALLW